MGLFSKERPEPSVRPTRTINGTHLADPEVLGSMNRRTRLLGECTRRLSSHPLAQPDAMSRPIGDGTGMEELAAVVATVFANEPSLARWVANRGALSFLHAQYVEDDSVPDLWRVMGIDMQPGDGGGLMPRAWQPPGSPRMTDEACENIVGLFLALDARLREYPRFEESSIEVLTADPLFAISPVIAYDFIAWSLVAALRDGVAANLLRLSDPAAFEGAGWYAEPIFSKSERYWNGDWTERCRVPGRQGEVVLPLV